jgi:hypothetical protein
MRLPIAILILLASACDFREQKHVKMVAAPPSLMAPPAPLHYDIAESVAEPSDQSSNEYSGELIMKSANFRFQVDDVEKSTKNIEKLTSTYNALIANENFSTDVNEKSNSIVIRVPSASFEVLLEELSKESLFIDYRRIISQNVTEEYHDINTRLKTKKEVRDRYTEILKTKAKTVEDILKAEEHISALQEEIESKEERKKFLESRVSMSMINLDIYQKVIYKETPTLVEKTYATKFTQALSNGWSIITSTSLYIISCWPLLFAGILILWGWRILRRKWRSTESV